MKLKAILGPPAAVPASGLRREDRRRLETLLRRRVNDPARLLARCEEAAVEFWRRRIATRTLPTRREAEDQLRRLRLAADAARRAGPASLEADQFLALLNDPETNWLRTRLEVAFCAMPMGGWQECLDILIAELQRFESQVRNRSISDWWHVCLGEVEVYAPDRPIGPTTFTRIHPSARNAAPFEVFSQLIGELEGFRPSEVSEIIATIAYVDPATVRQWVHRRAEARRLG